MMTTTPENKPSLLAAALNGYWQCTKCKHIGEPKNVGEADQQCTNCGKTAVIWMKTVDQGGPTDEQRMALESDESEQASAAQRVCYNCKRHAFILVAIVVGRAAKPDDFMCRGCLRAYLMEEENAKTQGGTAI